MNFEWRNSNGELVGTDICPIVQASREEGWSIKKLKKQCPIMARIYRFESQNCEMQEECCGGSYVENKEAAHIREMNRKGAQTFRRKKLEAGYTQRQIWVPKNEPTPTDDEIQILLAWRKENE
jgi:hypothetical protein